MKLSVVMPVFNEAATIERALASVLAQDCVGEVIVVDDCSTDGTRQKLDRLASGDSRIKLHQHSRNMGKGAALRTAFAHLGCEVTVVQDADLEYDPAEYHRMLEPIVSARADAVYGSRFIGSEAHRVLYFWHAVGNRFLTLLSNMFTNLNLTDMETCYKMVRTEVLERIGIEEDRFGFDPEITAKLAKLDLRIYEVAVSYHGRTYAEGKKIGWRDGLAAIWCIVKYGLRPAPGGRRGDG